MVVAAIATVRRLSLSYLAFLVCSHEQLLYIFQIIED